ncbi:MAG: sigma-54 interaction domain-containing protein [Spirochaetaceae bacterium]
MSVKASFHGMIGSSPTMEALFQAVRDVSNIMVPVLIHGESGTGKELVARAIHAESDRREAPFHAVNTGAIPRELIESELFGHEKGSFTGAEGLRRGIFEAAKGGTVFLDEIGTMEERTQISLLRFLETRRFTRVGGTVEHQADVRILAASNVDLGAAVAEGEFRPDLFYRLNVFPIHIAPLRGREQDIRELATHFLQRYAEEFQRKVNTITPEALAALSSFHWPGNVRQLSNVMIRLVVGSRSDAIEAGDVTEALAQSMSSLGTDVAPPASAATATVSPEGELSPGTSIEEAERQLIINTLSQEGISRTEAAKLLGISRKALYNKIKQYDIEV